MDLEERLGRALRDGLDGTDVRPGDLGAVRASGTRLRHQRRGAAVAAAATAVALVTVSVAALTGDARRSTVPDPAPPVVGSGAWEHLPDAPVPARSMPLVGWTGEEVVLVGGDPEPCPANADCDRVPTVASDGAAYDVDAGTWRVIAEAPVGMGYYFRTTMVGDTMVVFGDGRWWAYDAGDDDWTRLPDPPVPTRDSGSISSADGLVYALSRQGRVQVLDLAAGTWSQLPELPDELGGASVVATGDRVVVSGELVGARSLEPVVSAQVWDGERWTRAAMVQTNPFRHWAGERLVELDLQVVEGQDIPYGGRLDPATGKWSPLPDPPTSYGGDGWSLVAADGPLLLGWGFVYDDSAETWTRVPPKPEEAVGDGASAVLVDGRVVVVGGVDPLPAPTQDAPAQAWVWTP